MSAPPQSAPWQVLKYFSLPAKYFLLSVAAEIIQAMDLTADPCDDFFRFSCGGWMDNNAIPEGKNKWGRFYELRGEVDDALKGLKFVGSPSGFMISML